MSDSEVDHEANPAELRQSSIRAPPSSSKARAPSSASFSKAAAQLRASQVPQKASQPVSRPVPVERPRILPQNRVPVSPANNIPTSSYTTPAHVALDEEDEERTWNVGDMQPRGNTGSYPSIGRVVIENLRENRHFILGGAVVLFFALS